MDRNQNRAAKGALSQSNFARNLDEMGKRLGVDPVRAAQPGTSSATSPATSPASWPTGVSLLAQMVDACQRCEAEEVCNDWLVRAPQRIAKAPEFCPNAETFEKLTKGEG